MTIETRSKDLLILIPTLYLKIINWKPYVDGRECFNFSINPCGRSGKVIELAASWIGARDTWIRMRDCFGTFFKRIDLTLVILISWLDEPIQCNDGLPCIQYSSLAMGFELFKFRDNFSSLRHICLLLTGLYNFTCRKCIRIHLCIFIRFGIVNLV